MQLIEIDSANAIVLKLEAEQIDARLREAATKHNRRSMEIGYYGYLLKKKNLWPYLGMATEIDADGNIIEVPYTEDRYWKALRIGRSTWYKMVGIAEAFAQLPLEQLATMLIDNAWEMKDAPEEVRYDPELIRKAGNLSLEAFKSEVLVTGAARAGHPVGEHPDPLKISMTHSQKKVIIDGLHEWQEEHGIENEGKAMELLIAEYRGRISLVRFMSESLSLLRQTIEHCDAEHLSEVRSELQEILIEMQEVLARTIGDQPGEQVAT